MRSRTMSMAALAAALLLSVPPAHAALERSVPSYCEGADNGNVVVELDGGKLMVFGLQEDLDAPGRYFGTGAVSYHAQGVDIEDAAAQFTVELIPSPSASRFTQGVIDCRRATKLVSSVRVIGSTVKYVISTSNLDVDPGDENTCASMTFDVLIDDHPKALGKIKRPFAVKRISISGRAQPTKI